MSIPWGIRYVLRNQGPRDMAKINLRGLVNLDTTQSRWVEAVLADFNTFLSDHASAEKKASGMALSMASHYPDRPDILIAMADLAIEELAHYKQVINLILKRGASPSIGSQGHIRCRIESKGTKRSGRVSARQVAHRSTDRAKRRGRDSNS